MVEGSLAVVEGSFAVVEGSLAVMEGEGSSASKDRASGLSLELEEAADHSLVCSLEKQKGYKKQDCLMRSLIS